MKTKKPKRKLNYEPCTCNLWDFPHRPDPEWCLLMEYQRKAILDDYFPSRPRG